MNSPSTLSPLTEEDIAKYLMNAPDFFERHAHVLTGVQLTSPHLGRAVSLQERQAEMLRDKIKSLELRIVDMVRNGTDNLHIAQRMHRWSCDLLRLREPVGLPATILQGMQRHFDVPLAALRVWDFAPAYQGTVYAQPVSEDVRQFASSLTMPFCGPNLGFEPVAWLEAPDATTSSAESLALLPLRDGPIESPTPAFGLLVLGSPDPHRFEATMGTDFLARMAEMASAALARMRR